MKFLRKICLCLLAFLFLFSACNDDLVSLNEDPTSTTDFDWNYIFTTAVLQTAQNLIWWNNITYCARMMQQTATLHVPGGGDKYFEGGGGYYEACYIDISKRLSEVIRQTGPDGKDPQMINLYNAARVMKVFAFHIATDAYGDIPYFEANKAHDEGIFYPVFDPQQDIYMGMLQELSEAAGGFDENYVDMTSFSYQDIIYNGDITKWKKFAYSLLLRLAMRISNVEESTARTYIEEAINGGVFTSNEDNAFVPMATGPDATDLSINQNLLSKPYHMRETPTLKLSNTFIDFLRDNDDPRLMILTSGIGSFNGPKIDDPALQKGMPNGFDENTIRDWEGTTEDVDTDNTYSGLNELMLDIDEPIMLHNYAEVEFLKAEAVYKGWISGDPETHYNNGVRAAMQMYVTYDGSFTVSDAEVDAYLAAHPYNPTNALEMIGTQYWVATFLNSHESWANWRRTEYPVLIPVDYPGNHTNGTIPRRLIFDLETVSKNEENYQAAIKRMGPDKMTTRVWWDGGN
jgi:hypothetical protein